MIYHPEAAMLTLMRKTNPPHTMKQYPLCLLWLVLVLFPGLHASTWALTATATASSQASSSLGPFNTLDGNSETFWSSSASSTQHKTEWIRFDFDQLAAIRGVTLTPRANGYGFPTDFALEYSYDEDGTYWFPVNGTSREDFATPTTTVNLAIMGRVYARRLRLMATGLGKDDFGNFYFQLAGISFLEHTTRIPYQLEREGDFSAQINNLWNIYGALGDTTDAVYSFGNEPAYFEWMALKYLWSETSSSYVSTLLTRMLTHPMCANGYVWSWGNQMLWPTGSGGRHEENNAKYILGCWRYWCWKRDDSFFNLSDSTKVTSPGAPSCEDVSQGMTIKEKLRLAMQYLDEERHGNEGGILLEDSGETDGTTSGDPTNYWDNWRFGYKNAYDNIYYYAALEAMAQMEEVWGNTERGAELHARRAGVRAAYNTEFWSTTKGRYIGTKDINGTVRDYGFTFLNTEAVYYGLADQSQAESIYSWLSGTRIISGETSTGTGIYALKWAPRANTIAAEKTGPPYWWEDLGGAIRVDTNAAKYGNHLENGGAILYTSFYDVLARAKYLGIGNADTRLGVILDEFRTDQLRRDPANSAGAAWVYGIIGEYPESGMVGALPVYLYGGLEADARGLHLKPQFPEGMTGVVIRGITYAGTVLDLAITPTTITITSRASSGRPLYYFLEEITAGSSHEFEYEEGTELLLTLDARPESTVNGWEMYR